MIFVTVGAQMPFDRLVRAVDAWAGANPDVDVFAQIGSGRYRPRNMPSTRQLDPVEFRQRLFDAQLIVTHAGMGTIITALEFTRPIVVLPRRADRQETRNDHQVGTARALSGSRGITVAWDEQELAGRLDRRAEIPAPTRAASHASVELLSALRQFIRTGEVRPAQAPLVGASPSAATDTPSQTAPRRAA